jgi:hypothetical protein
MKFKLKYHRSLKGILSDLVGYGINRKFDILVANRKIIAGNSIDKITKKFTLTDLINGEVITTQEDQIKNNNHFDLTFSAVVESSSKPIFQFRATNNQNRFDLSRQDNLKKYQIIADSKWNAVIKLNNEEIARIKSNRGLLDDIGMPEIITNDNNEDPMMIGYLLAIWRHLLEREEAPSLLFD